MSEHNYWTTMRRRRISRRTMLGASAKAGVGAAGLALVGCGDDDDDSAPAVAATEEQAEEAQAQAQTEQAQAQAQTEQAEEAQAQAEQAEEEAVAVATEGDFGGVRRGGQIADPDYFSREPPSLDPFIESSFLAQYIGTHSYSRMMKFDTGPGVAPQAEIDGDAAESFEIVDDQGLEFVFNLRPGLAFHDKPPLNGRPVVAADVVSSYERFITESPNQALFSLVDSVEAINDSQVKFTLSDSFAGFIENMASPSGLFIFSQEANAGDIDPAKEEGIIGSGPWEFESLTPAVEITFTANPNWWQKATAPDGRPLQLPLVDRLQHLINTEYATKFSLFVGEAVDWWDFDANNRDIPVMLEQVPDVQMIPDRGQWLFSGWQFNQSSDGGLWQDPRARIAISKAIDRDGLIEAFGELKATAEFGINLPNGWNTLVPWGKGGDFWWLDPKSEFGQTWADNLVFDPADARLLLEAAGYDGSPIDMNYLQATYGTIYDQFTEAQLPMLAEIGLNVNSEIREYAQQWSSEASRDFSGVYYNYVTPFGTIDEYMQLWFSPGNDDVRHPAQRKIRTPEIDALVSAQRGEFDRDARREIVHDVIRQATEIMNVAPTVMGRWGSTILAHPWVHNFQVFDSAGYGVPSEEWVWLWTERDNPA